MVVVDETSTREGSKSEKLDPELFAKVRTKLLKVVIFAVFHYMVRTLTRIQPSGFN